MDLILPAPAKINLFLHITGRRPDGYHNLQTIFQFLDWSDTLHFHYRAASDIEISGNFGTLPQENNLIYRAARALQRQHPGCPGAHIHVEKTLPTGAGMGGGSSNAATTLIALNHLWGLHRPAEELFTIGRSLGADIPIFLFGHAAWGEGIGDILTPCEPPTPTYVLVIHRDKVETAEIFRDPELTRNTPSLKIGSFRWGMGHNDFEPLVRRRLSSVRQTFELLQSHGNPRMSGSGSSVFMPVASRQAANALVQELKERWDLTSYVCQGQNVSALVHAAQAQGLRYSHWGVAKR